MERFSLEKLNETEAASLEISNRFAAFENLGTEVDINRYWETVKENIQFSAYRVYVIMNSRSISHVSTKDARTIRSEETSQIALVTESKRNKWR
jgi:hypothetical protein